MEIKCNICGYNNKNTDICVRCRATLEALKCSGNCSICLLSKKDKEEKTTKICSYK